MKILHVAKHGRHDNCDEDAIAWALRQLGHEVLLIDEGTAVNFFANRRIDADLILFHKWPDAAAVLPGVCGCPAAFWNFDMVEGADRLFVAKSAQRVEWMRAVTPLVTLGFCTDGDWVAKDLTGKLVWLTQGADERVMGRGRVGGQPRCDVLFTGTAAHDSRRASHLEHLARRCRGRFHHVGGFRGSPRVHGRQLADLVANSMVVIAPDSPATHRYWSNRVYLILGFGGCLVHPRCEGLAGQYDLDADLATYRDRDECDLLIDRLLADPSRREALSSSGLDRTKRENTYRHRCKQLIEEVRRRIST